MVSNDTFMVTVVEHRLSGIAVKDENGEAGWLPYSELSYETSAIWESRDAIREKYPSETPLDVVVIGGGSREGSDPIVSVAAAIRDPWKEDVPEWTKVKTPKIMVVTHTFSRNRYRGTIQPGVEAIIEREDFEEALGDKAKAEFYVPRVGDRLAGIVVDLDIERRRVKLSVSELFKDIRAKNSASAIDMLAEHSEADSRTLATIYETSDDKSGRLTTARPGRVLILGDDKQQAECFGRFLDIEGFETLVCSTPTEAYACLGIVDGDTAGPQALDEEAACEKDLDAAIIDIHLADDEALGSKGDGIAFARRLKKYYRRCRIYFISGDPDSADLAEQRAEAARDLDVCGFLFKPVPADELLHWLDQTTERDGYDVFMEYARSEIATSPSKEAQDGAAVLSAKETRDRAVNKILSDLQKGLKADSVFLFSMNRVTFETTIVAQCGEPLANQDQYLQRLRSSPVSDVCLPRKDQVICWYDEDTSNDFGKHRYLLYCYSAPRKHCDLCRKVKPRPCKKHWYGSCAAASVSAPDEFSPAYAVFAISMEPRAFPEATAEWQMRLAAAELSNALRQEHDQKSRESEHSFLMTGRSACTVGHDLCNSLQFGIDINTALALARALRSGSAGQASLDELLNVLEEASNRLRLATDVAQSFRDLSRDQDEPAEEVRFVEILKGKRGVILAAHPETSARDVEVHQTLCDTRAEEEGIVRIRRNAMVRVFQNLLNNSAQQIGDLGVLPRGVRVDPAIRRQEEEGGAEGPEMLCVDVIDSGPGIHWDDRKRIFRAKESTKKNGSGMGLFIAQEEVAKLGGSIEVSESVLGLGSKFRVWLPLAENEDTGGGGD